MANEIEITYVLRICKEDNENVFLNYFFCCLWLDVYFYNYQMIKHVVIVVNICILCVNICLCWSVVCERYSNFFTIRDHICTAP